ncbi:MAG: hypothetical protein Q8839_02485 [Candidatus Phytoplasma australasiaticum]|nr:hypothetical protein [Candidatus Phytoplasma australasiaticum]MDV3153862.1 hypothetical protein [Candidatus Phytoplasma australasiaticum]MDV3167718.1 hypothetical protein [Candidatus Phytoplasma australasiaticum]MDV3181126.1 hypothetical protein [Candidatus Phytoplasma australasiaticum]MDV3183341.1 hypothetical protein [Candidatus Phytoplasma australasiaticum]
MNLNKELRHYKNLEKIFNNKIVQITKELDLKKQTLIEHKIYYFKKIFFNDRRATSSIIEIKT